MQNLWSFLSNKDNREVLGWAGGGLVVVAAGLWAVIVYVFPPVATSASKASSGVEANCGSVAVGGNVSGSVVTTGNATSSDCSRKPK